MPGTICHSMLLDLLLGGKYLGLSLVSPDITSSNTGCTHTTGLETLFDLVLHPIFNLCIREAILFAEIHHCFVQKTVNNGFSSTHVLVLMNPE